MCAVNRLAVCGKEHGVWHLGTVCLACVLFVFSKNLKATSACFLLLATGDDIKAVNFLTIFQSHQHLFVNENAYFFFRSGLAVYDREEEHQNQGEPRYPADNTNPIVAEMHHHVYSLGSLVGYGKHLRVDHVKDEFAKGRKHINGIEVFWGHAKTRLVRFRGMAPSTFNLHIKECELRFNHKGLDLSRYP